MARPTSGLWRGVGGRGADSKSFSSYTLWELQQIKRCVGQLCSTEITEVAIEQIQRKKSVYIHK